MWVSPKTLKDRHVGILGWEDFLEGTVKKGLFCQ